MWEIIFSLKGWSSTSWHLINIRCHALYTLESPRAKASGAQKPRKNLGTIIIIFFFLWCSRPPSRQWLHSALVLKWESCGGKENVCKIIHWPFKNVILSGIYFQDWKGANMTCYGPWTSSVMHRLSLKAINGRLYIFERERAWGGSNRGRGRESILSRLHA